MKLLKALLCLGVVTACFCCLPGCSGESGDSGSTPSEQGDSEPESDDGSGTN